MPLSDEANSGEKGSSLATEEGPSPATQRFKPWRARGAASAVLSSLGILVAAYSASANLELPIGPFRVEKSTLVVIGLLVFVIGLNSVAYRLAGGGPKPKRNSGESTEDYQARVRDLIWGSTATLTSIAITSVIALWAFNVASGFWLAVSAGALGGLTHEIVQSNGTIFFPSQKDDGLYLGGISGLILGGAAGLLILSGTAAAVTTTLVVTTFSAGLGLKGV